MDLNDLFSRHQISLMNARAATTREARSAHQRLAALYAERIDAQRPHRSGRATAALRL